MIVEKRIIANSSVDESCTVAEHSSGLKIYVCEKPMLGTSYAVFGTKYGSIDNGFTVDGKTVNLPEGIAHFLEHKLFESEDGDAFSRFSATGAYANAYTSFDRTCYLFSCSDKFYDNLYILLDFVTHPYFTEKTVNKEQGIIGQEIRMYDDSPSWRVLFNMLEKMYHNHSVKVDIAGTTDSIAKITDKLLYECYNTFYDLSNMFVCVAGNVKACEVIEFIDKNLPSSSGSRFTRAVINEPDGVIENYVSQELEVALPLFTIGYKEHIAEGAECTVEQIISTQILLDLIAGEASTLYEALTNKGLINDEFSTEYFTGRGYAVPMFSGESAEPLKVLECIKEEINRIKSDGIDEKLFEALKKDMYGSAIRQFNSAEGIGSALVGCAVSGDGLFDSLDVLSKLSVEDVYERLSVFNEDNLVLSVINPKEK